MRRGVRPLLVVALAAALTACNQEGAVTVHRITFNGLRAVDSARLKAVLATRENAKVPLVGWELPWGRKHSFDRSRIEADLRRIEAFCADRGFPDARVTGVDIRPNPNQDAVDVVITVEEGQPVLVSSVDFVGFDQIPENHLENLRSGVPVKVGRPRDRQVVLTSREMALNELRDHGFPYARVDTAEDDGPTGKTAAITFNANPGLMAVFGPLTIQNNNRSVSDEVVLRELTIKPGDLYRRSAVQESQRRLYNLALFQFVSIQPANPERQDAEVPMRVAVAEGNHQRVNFGVGYGTEEKARADIEYAHVNFLGAARSAGFQARWSSLDRGVRAQFSQPYFIRRGVSLGAEAQQWYTYTPAYQSVITGGNVTISQRLGSQSSWSLSLTREHSTSSIADAVRDDPSLIDDLIALGLDPATGTQEGTLVALGLDLRHSTADNLLNARRGYQANVHVEEAGYGVPGTFNYYLVTAEGRHYLPLGDDFVVATRLQLGNIDAADNGGVDVPFSKKFFLGGASTLRGWGRYEVSPIGTSGFPVGGNSLLGASAELRARLKGSLGGVLFLDAGNVWADEWRMRLDDLRYAAGIGLRYSTPVGPIRFDLGYQLNPIPGLLVSGAPQRRRLRFHFSIGQAF
jgi:outer membrane protein insertion porin family/translocation and assembly module TamA